MTRVDASTYPETPSQRDRWILERRGPREIVSPDRPYAYHVEDERFASGEIGPVATIFLTNRECPWRCAMCDLWRHTLAETVPVGAIPLQIEYALSRLAPARQIKLYNSGSFFDPRAIPPDDYDAIAALVHGFERVIVESHPSLLGDRCTTFQELIGTKLEVAMGLETAHPVALEKLNKRMTLDQFAAGAKWLEANSIALRTFILVQPPFIAPAEAALWATRSIDFALRCQATAVTLIPTRATNGSVEQLAIEGEFTSPDLAAVEVALSYGLTQARSGAAAIDTRIFADLWDLDRFASCDTCRQARIERLLRMNHTQRIADRVQCFMCGGSA